MKCMSYIFDYIDLNNEWKLKLSEFKVFQEIYLTYTCNVYICNIYQITLFEFIFQKQCKQIQNYIDLIIQSKCLQLTCYEGREGENKTYQIKL